MTEKKSGKKDLTSERSEQVNRKKLPDGLELRLRSVWSKLGHLIEWCDGPDSWMKMFCSEARPYRETFYWEAVAEMVAEYMSAHPKESPAVALTDCLIATQCSPTAGDPPRMGEFREAWRGILDRSRAEIEGFIQADLDLAIQDGTSEIVARLYAADYERWKKARNSPAELLRIALGRKRMYGGGEINQEHGQQRLAIIAMSPVNCRCLWFERFGDCLSAEGGGK